MPNGAGDSARCPSCRLIIINNVLWCDVPPSSGPRTLYVHKGAGWYGSICSGSDGGGIKVPHTNHVLIMKACDRCPSCRLIIINNILWYDVPPSSGPRTLYVQKGAGWYGSICSGSDGGGIKVPHTNHLMRACDRARYNRLCRWRIHRVPTTRQIGIHLNPLVYYT